MTKTPIDSWRFFVC